MKEKEFNINLIRIDAGRWQARVEWNDHFSGLSCTNHFNGGSKRECLVKVAEFFDLHEWPKDTRSLTKILQDRREGIYTNEFRSKHSKSFDHLTEEELREKYSHEL